MRRSRPAVLALLALSATAAVLGVAHEPAVAAETSRAALEAPGWIGITMDRGSDLGVRVEHVVRNGPAEKAGLRAGDRITAIDGSAVLRPDTLATRVASKRAGEAVAAAVERFGQALTLRIVVASRPSSTEIARMDLVGAPAPAWPLATPLAGAPKDPSDLRGRVVVLDFWATWCGPCRAIAPRLSALNRRFGAQGLSVVGITPDEPEQAARTAEKLRMNYPSVVDERGDTTRAYGVASYPTLVLVDKRGVVRDVLIGFDPSGDAALEAKVRALLAEAAPPPAAAAKAGGER